MAAEALLRPQSSGSAILAGGKIGTAGTTIYMKVQSAQFNLSIKVQDTTGDGDLLAHYDHDNELRGQISLRGFMLADNHIGIEKLTTTSTTEFNPLLVDLTLGSNRKYKFKLCVSGIVVDWNRVGGLVGVAISGFMTDAYASDGTEALDEA